MDKKFYNITETIVTSDLCIGCGVCAAVCPPHVLDMKFNENAEYIAVEFKEGCLPRCDLCFRACPFVDGNDNEDILGAAEYGKEAGIRHTEESGYFLNAYVGHSLSNEQRLKSSSGGLTRWFLQELLSKNIVDAIICVFANEDPEKLFKFSVAENEQQIENAAKSCYYPVELSEQLHNVLSIDRRYAIVGLPCYVKAIKLAMKKSKKLASRIKVTAALVCGQTKSKFFAEYLCALGGGEISSLNTVEFRVKDSGRPANNFGFHFTCDSGLVLEKTVFWTEGMDKAWTRCYFKPNACNYCDDIFGEVADISFMDAWLEPFMKDFRGTNIVVVRNKEIQKLLLTGKTAGEISLDAIPIEQALFSQQAVIDVKRSHLGLRLFLARLFVRKHIPRKRVSASGFSPYRLLQTFIISLYAPLSKILFRYAREKSSLIFFERVMSLLFFANKVINYCEVLYLRATKRLRIQK